MARTLIARGMWILGLGTLCWSAACATPESAATRQEPCVARLPPSQMSQKVPPAPSYTPRPIEIGRSVENRPICGEVHGDGSDVILMLATIHGNEAAGTPLLERLSLYMREHPELIDGRQVVLIPLVNPDGLARNIRHNVGGVDLNRNFPSSNFAGSRRHGERPLSQPESRALYALLREYPPDRVISIHQPIACIDYDGPARSLADAMGKWSDLPVRRIGSRPGSLGSFVGLTLGKPIITLELPRDADGLSDDARWKRYGPMLVAAIVHPEPLTEDLVRAVREGGKRPPREAARLPADRSAANSFSGGG